MSRLVSSLALLLATCSSGAVQAADYPDLRPAYPDEWQLGEGLEPLGFELGLRYWYSKGGQNLSIPAAAGQNYSARDTSQILEGHLRIDDYSSDAYLKAMGGYAAFIDGTYDATGQGAGLSMHGGKIAYAVADFGYTPFGNDAFRFGGFVGYQYWNDSPDMGRAPFTGPSGGDSELNDFASHSLRLGITAHADISDVVDVNAEVAVIPYSWMQGTYGAFDANIPGVTQASAGSITGNLYGGTAELMLGFHPTENMAVRVGGRAWYLEGKPRMTFDTDIGGLVGEAVFSKFRYGALAELTYKF
jgi:hypothetical protein